ncbi:MAG: hypothetical protein P1U42_04605 [Phycisphaerales bacterium]|nr:hypothetical protein [Phycisphaerales bacterium]
MVDRIAKLIRVSKCCSLALIPTIACSTHAGSLDVNQSRELASHLRGTQGQSSLGSERVYQPTSDNSRAGWFVERGDNSSLRISVLAQTRYMFSERDAGFVAPGSEKTYGFSQPRTRIAFDGTIVSSQFSYRLTMDFGDAELSRGRGLGPSLAGSTGAPRLQDAYAQYNFAGKREGYYLKFGQFQNILLTEESIESEYQLAIDRTLASEIFGPGYTQGIALGHVSDTFAWEANITDGGRYLGSREADNTSFNSVDESDLAIGFRGDIKLEGSWDQFQDFTSFQGSSPATKIGFGALYQFHGQTNPGFQAPGFLGTTVESAQIFTWTLDYQHEGDGWNFFAGYFGQYIDWEFALATAGLMNNAIVVQGGWFITEQSELFARLETFWLDKLFRNGFSTPNGYIHRIGTVGWNYYFLPESHAAKFSADASYAFDSLFALSVGGGDSIGLPDPGVTGFQGLTEHEYVLRIQLQFMF